MCLIVPGTVGSSVNVTIAPHLAATIPGKEVPEPTSNILLPGNSNLCSQIIHASTGDAGQT